MKRILFFLLVLFTSLFSNIPRKIERVEEIVTPGDPHVINPNVTKEIRFKFKTNNSGFDFEKTQFTVSVKYNYDRNKMIIRGLIDSISIPVQKNYRKGHLYWELFVDSIAVANKITWGAIPCASPHFSIDSSHYNIINDSLSLNFTIANKNPGYNTANLGKPLEVVLKTKTTIIEHQISNYYRADNQRYNPWEMFDFNFKIPFKDDILFVKVDPNNSFIKLEDEYIFPFYNGFKSQRQLNREIAISLGSRTGTIQNPVPLNNSVKDIFFINKQKGWILGGSDFILETNDGGFSWSIRYLSELDSTFKDEQLDYSPMGISSIYFIDEYYGWLIAQDRKNLVLFKTKDGGEKWDWNKISKPPGEITGLFFVDQNNGWFIGGFSFQMDGSMTVTE